MVSEHVAGVNVINATQSKSTRRSRVNTSFLVCRTLCSLQRQTSAEARARSPTVSDGILVGDFKAVRIRGGGGAQKESRRLKT
jgi:hypothetical protein